MEKEIRDHVFTSGEAALNYLKKNLSKNFFSYWPPRDFDLFKDFEKNKSENIENVIIYYAQDYLMIMMKI